MNKQEQKCCICGSAVSGGGLIIVGSTPTQRIPGTVAVLKIVTLSADAFTCGIAPVVCGKGHAIEWFSREMDKLLGIERAADMAPSRLKYHVCPKTKSGCAKAYTRQEVHDGISLDVACCGDGYKPIHALERCPAISLGVECVKEGE